VNVGSAPSARRKRRSTKPSASTKRRPQRSKPR
jgi:hypothetical protein